MYEERVLAFIDVLGFSEEIKKSVVDDVEDSKQTKRINSLINVIQTDLGLLSENEDQNIKYKEEQLNIVRGSRVVNQFSDSILISFQVKEESGIFFMLLDILFLCMTSLQHNFLLRGSIVKNKLYHTREKIFGPGLVEAYEMERSLAIYPRIVLDNEILELSKQYHGRQNEPEIEEEYVRSLVKRDFDGMYYIDYFGAVESELDNTYQDMPEYFLKLKEVIQKMKDNRNVSVRSKYLWLREKYNELLLRYKDVYSKKDVSNRFPELYRFYRNNRTLG